jgi:hypothetical protein
MLYAKLNGVLIESRIDDSELDQFKTDLYTTYSPTDLEFGVESDDVIAGWWDEKTEALKTYADHRKAEYPSIEECLHAILDDDLEALQVKRQEVKNRYPKP